MREQGKQLRCSKLKTQSATSLVTALGPRQPGALEPRSPALKLSFRNDFEDGTGRAFGYALFTIWRMPGWRHRAAMGWAAKLPLECAGTARKDARYGLSFWCSRAFAGIAQVTGRSAPPINSAVWVPACQLR